MVNLTVRCCAHTFDIFVPSKNGARAKKARSLLAAQAKKKRLGGYNTKLMTVTLTSALRVVVSTDRTEVPVRYPLCK